jgi:hypothetical protein
MTVRSLRGSVEMLQSGEIARDQHEVVSATGETVGVYGAYRYEAPVMRTVGFTLIENTLRSGLYMILIM